MTRSKIITYLWIIGTTAALAAIPAILLTCENMSLKRDREASEANVEAYKKLTDSLQRAVSEVATSKELDDFAEEHQLDLSLIQEDLSSLGARLEAVASSSGTTKTIVRNYYTSTTTVPSTVDVPVCESDGRPIDVYGYTKQVETTQLEDSSGMRIADASFEAAKERPWSSKIYGIEYTVNNTIGKKSNGQLVLHTELLAKNSQVQPNKTFRIEGFQSTLLQLPNRPRFDAWDPTLYLSGQFGLGVHPELQFSAAITLGFSIMSYGDWRFIGVTVGLDAYQQTFFASFVPFLYNVGEPLPFFSDIEIGPYIGIDHERSISVGILVGTRL